MKLNTIKTTLKPGFVLIAINSALCTAFAVAAGLSLGISWIFYDYFGLPFPLMPIVVIAFTGLSLGVWFFFGRRLKLGREQRTLTALAGVSPLLAVSAISLLGALTFVALPVDPGLAILGPVAVSVVAFLAAAACAACVIGLPKLQGSSTGKPAD